MKFSIAKILKNPYFWLGLIVILGFLVRLYKINSPIADWHSWRQADTAAVTRNFVKFGFNPFVPKYDDLSGAAEHPIANPGGFRFVEFPIYNMVVYPIYLLFGVNETYHRLVSVLFSLGSIILIFLISRRYLDTFTALISAFIFALLPFNIFFSRTILPEPVLVFFSLGMLYFIDRWIWESKRFLGIWGFSFTMIAFLIKPYAIFFLLPLLYSVYSRRDQRHLWKKFILFIILALLPFVLWRLWILNQPEGIPASSWLANGDGIRFRPAFWWWIISERMGREIMGATGLVLFIVGMIIRPKDDSPRAYVDESREAGKYFLHFWALSIFLYFIIFATGNVRHNYYQVVFIPVASIFLANGFVYLLQGDKSMVPRIWTILLSLLFFSLSFYFGWMQVKEFYKINNPAIVEAGKRADQILPKDAVVLAPYNGDTAFLYQTNRPGWPLIPISIKELIADYGVSAYVSTAKDKQTAWVMKHFKVLEDKPDFIIADLTKLTKPFDDTLDPQP